MNKNHRDRTQFSPEIKDSRKRKMDFLISVHSLSAITQANNYKQYILLMIYKLQVYISFHNINYKNYLDRGPFTPCGKITHKENLYQSQNDF